MNSEPIEYTSVVQYVSQIELPSEQARSRQGIFCLAELPALSTFQSSSPIVSILRSDTVMLLTIRGLPNALLRHRPRPDLPRLYPDLPRLCPDPPRPCSCPTWLHIRVHSRNMMAGRIAAANSLERNCFITTALNFCFIESADSRRKSCRIVTGSLRSHVSARSKNVSTLASSDTSTICTRASPNSPKRSVAAAGLRSECTTITRITTSQFDSCLRASRSRSLSGLSGIIIGGPTRGSPRSNGLGSPKELSRYLIIREPPPDTCEASHARP